MNRDKCIHILRNPYGHSRDELRLAQQFACDEIERLEEAYINMRDWARQNGVDTTAKHP